MARPYPWIPFCLRNCSGFFASSLAIIRLNKLTTLSLRLLPSSQAFREEGAINRYIRSFGYKAAPADIAPMQRAGPHLNPFGVGTLPPTTLSLEGLLFMAYLLRALCNIRLDKLSTLSLRLFPPLKA